MAPPGQEPSALRVPSLKTLWPPLGAVLHGDDDDLLVEYGVGNDVGRVGHNEFAGVLDAARSPEMRHVGQAANRAQDAVVDALGGSGVVLGDIGAGAFERGDRDLPPDDLHTGLGFFCRRSRQLMVGSP